MADQWCRPRDAPIARGLDFLLVLETAVRRRESFRRSAYAVRIGGLQSCSAERSVHRTRPSFPRTVQRHNPSNFIRQACSAWRDAGGGFADADRDRGRSYPPAITMAQ